MITSPATRAFLTCLIDDLEEAGCSPVLLRNFENFPKEIGNDLDVFVRPERLSRAFSILDACARAQGGKIGHIHRRGYFVAVWLRFPDCEPPVHIDLYHGALTWHGLHFLDNDELVRESQPATPGARHRIPAPYHEALISLLASILWGGYFKQRYQDRLNALLADTTQRQQFTEVMERNFGREGRLLATAVAESEARTLVNDSLCRRMRQRLVFRFLQVAPLASSADWIKHWFEELVCYGWRLPGMAIEYDGAAWKTGEAEQLGEKIGLYFGGTHMMNGEAAQLSDRVKIRRLRGKNHLVLLRGNRYAINGQPCRTTIGQPTPNVATMAEAALRVLDERIQDQFTTR